MIRWFAADFLKFKNPLHDATFDGFDSEQFPAGPRYRRTRSTITRETICEDLRYQRSLQQRELYIHQVIQIQTMVGDIWSAETSEF